MACDVHRWLIGGCGVQDHGQLPVNRTALGFRVRRHLNTEDKGDSEGKDGLGSNASGSSGMVLAHWSSLSCKNGENNALRRCARGDC